MRVRQPSGVSGTRSRKWKKEIKRALRRILAGNGEDEDEEEEDGDDLQNSKIPFRAPVDRSVSF